MSDINPEEFHHALEGLKLATVVLDYFNSDSMRKHAADYLTEIKEHDRLFWSDLSLDTDCLDANSLNHWVPYKHWNYDIDEFDIPTEWFTDPEEYRNRHAERIAKRERDRIEREQKIADEARAQRRAAFEKLKQEFGNE